MANENPSLTRLFRRWATEHLGYVALETGADAEGGDPPRRYVVGVRAERLHPRVVLCQRAAWALFIGAVVIRNVADSPSLTVGSLHVANFLLAFAMFSFAVAALGRIKTRTYVWIDVRRKTMPLTCATVEETRRAVANVRSNPKSSWSPTDVLVVAGESGFEPDAVVLAESAEIACYRLTESGFERVRSGRP